MRADKGFEGVCSRSAGLLVLFVFCFILDFAYAYLSWPFLRAISTGFFSNSFLVEFFFIWWWRMYPPSRWRVTSRVRCANVYPSCTKSLEGIPKFQQVWCELQTFTQVTRCAATTCRASYKITFMVKKWKIHWVVTLYSSTHKIKIEIHPFIFI